MRHSSEILDSIMHIKSIPTDAKLSKLLGVAPSTVTSWRKRNAVPFMKIFELCESENLSLDYVFFGNDNTVNSHSNPEVEELVGMARHVLESGDETAFQTLERTIRYLSHSTQLESRLSELESRFEGLEGSTAGKIPPRPKRGVGK